MIITRSEIILVANKRIISCDSGSIRVSPYKEQLNTFIVLLCNVRDLMHNSNTTPLCNAVSIEQQQWTVNMDQSLTISHDIDLRETNTPHEGFFKTGSNSVEIVDKFRDSSQGEEVLAHFERSFSWIRKNICQYKMSVKWLDPLASSVTQLKCLRIGLFLIKAQSVPEMHMKEGSRKINQKVTWWLTFQNPTGWYLQGINTHKVHALPGNPFILRFPN